MTVPVGLPPCSPDGCAPASRGATRTPSSAFGQDEHATRLVHARTALRRAGFDGCVSVAPETLYYPWAMARVGQRQQPPGADLPDRRRRAHPRPARRRRVGSRGRRPGSAMSGPIGCSPRNRPSASPRRRTRRGSRRVSLAVELESYALPHALGLRLGPRARAGPRGGRGPAPWAISASSSQGAELAYLRDAARYAGLGLEAARRTLRPGITEIALAGAIEGAMRAAGSDSGPSRRSSPAGRARRAATRRRATGFSSPATWCTWSSPAWPGATTRWPSRRWLSLSRPLERGRSTSSRGTRCARV